jgi:molecular chaperone DnaK
VILVGGMTRMPAVQERVRRLFGRESNKGVNPDEVVALGAAIQAAILKGDVQDVLLLDVIPLSLGIETLGGVMTKLIEKNTTIPTRRSEVFSTAEDNQPAVTVHVLQGEREIASGNKTLGRFELTGIPPAPRGAPQIEVTFDIDANGIVQVSAKDKATGQQQSIRITHSSGLTRQEIDRMVREAELHADEDLRKKALVEARNAADLLVYSTEKTMAELGSQADPSTLPEMETALQALKDAMKGDDVERIRRLTESLQRASQGMGEAIYRKSRAGASDTTHRSKGRPQGTGRNAPEEEVVDAEFEEVN